MITISIYSPAQHEQWNHFTNEAKNSTFMHQREYMDYHSSRFTDCSLIAHDGNRIVAVLPANRVDSTLYSHQGLTYGGWLCPTLHFDITNMLEVFDAMAEFLPTIGIHTLIYKPVPHIYHRYPAEEDIYAIFRHDGALVGSNISTVVPIKDAIRFNENSRRAMRLAIKEGITVSETEDYAPYWGVLTDLLNTRYGTDPVHSLSEITLLHSLFPLNIRLFTVYSGDTLLGGTVIYHTRMVAHAQYIATTQQGRDMKTLPLLFHHLIHDVFRESRYFDFGTSNGDGGHFLNEGLVMQKTGMGGRGIVYNTYKLTF
ncbi:MAG: GNAT family N-acetyltransferase [Muribaculaceae bacterium]|jgi:hypothetical protein|nr:GNAT family N-acetyltransferase [Muribaculaceae bacterium]